MPNNIDLSEGLKASKAISEVDSLIKKLQELSGSVGTLNTALANNKKADDEGTTATKKKTEALTALEKLEKTNIQTIEKLNTGVSKQALALERSKQALASQTKDRKASVAAEREAANAISQANNALKKEIITVRDAEKANVKLRLAVKNSKTTTEEGRAGIIKYNAAINKNSKFIDSNSDKQKKAKQNVGGYTDGINKSKVALGKMNAALGAVGVSLGAAAFVKGLKAFANNVISNSQIVADELDILKAKVGSTFDAIGRAIATSDFKNLAEDIKAARIAAGDYTVEQDDLGDSFRSLKIEAAEVEAAVYKLRGIYTSTGTDSVTALKAVGEANALLLGLEERRAEVTTKAVNSELDLVQKTFSLTKDQKALVVSYIRDFGKAEGEYQSFISGSEDALKRRAELQKVVNDGGTAGAGFVHYTEEAKAAQIEIDNLNSTILNGYDKVQNAISGVSDEQRTRITEAISNVAIQERATQRLINETTRQEAAIKKRGSTEGEITLGATSNNNTQLESVDLLSEAYSMLGVSIADVGETHKGTIAEMLASIDEFAAKSIATSTQLSDIDKQALIDEKSRKAAKKLAYEDSKNAAINSAFESFSFISSLQDREVSNIEAKVEAGTITEEAGAAAIDKINRKQAITQKAQALAEIAINTAVGISKVLGQTGIFGLAAWIPVAALGAVQAATVLATDIPQFWTGADSTDARLAVVGERGSEAVEQNGSVFFTPSTATLMDLGSGSKRILDAGDTEKKYGTDLSGLENGINKLIAKPISDVNITIDGIAKITRVGNAKHRKTQRATR